MKLPTSTREAFVPSPKYVKKVADSPKPFIKPAVPVSKEQWLKRYEKQYPVRQSDANEEDLLSISQAESVIPSYMPEDKRLEAAKCKVDKIKVPPALKVQEWLQVHSNYIPNTILLPNLHFFTQKWEKKEETLSCCSY